MKLLREKWAVMIDITNICGHGCLYCCKHVRHLAPYQIGSMSEASIRQALLSVRDFPGKVGITGGEPLDHPGFREVCAAVRELIPKEKAIIFTSHKAKHEALKGIIDQTFGEVYVNYHTPEQREICTHQPLLLAVGDMVENTLLRQKLIHSCWCNDMWSPVVSRHGAFFCDCAAGLESVLNLHGGWKVEDGWWSRDDYRDQMDTYCQWCGMCLPYPAQSQASNKEMISRSLYEEFQRRGMQQLTGMEIADKPLTVTEVMHNICCWSPWTNRQDRGFEGPEYVNV